ncbi:hypothetical protein [Afipia sp. GAS231]|uniref:hypothetical protein n=1 Tax=Afipia sp. GAS231 TaxID=1882747 RepID=UPI00087CC373|nr:hypothetical protein [Afipia sp. GAS231]SDN18899.1 hypothetical protein SAMN05444050_0931 [Afipia sp. GAS231]
MTDHFKREIERLLDEPPAAGQPSDRLRSRLAATLSEGLSDASADANAGNPAAMAAFIDGQLTGAARDKLAGALAQDPGLRADMESAADLVSSIADSPVKVPKHLLARASAEFAPAPPRPAEARARWSLSLADLLPRQRLALAMVAALVAVVAVPAGMMINSRLGGGGGEPELSNVSDADIEAARVKACRDKIKKDAEKAGTSKTAAPAAKETSDGSKPKDPCDPPEPKRDGAVKK